MGAVGLAVEAALGTLLAVEAAPAKGGDAVTDISEILNSEAHDAPSVARRAMEIIRRLEAEREEARRLAEGLWISAHRKGEYPRERLPWEPQIAPDLLQTLGHHRERYGEW